MIFFYSEKQSHQLRQHKLNIFFLNYIYINKKAKSYVVSAGAESNPIMPTLYKEEKSINKTKIYCYNSDST